MLTDPADIMHETEKETLYAQHEAQDGLKSDEVFRQWILSGIARLIKEGTGACACPLLARATLNRQTRAPGRIQRAYI
jgi:hypothetical protein